MLADGGGRRRAARELPRPRLRRGLARRRGAALRRRRSRASSRAAAPAPCSRTCPRSTRCSPGRSRARARPAAALVHALEAVARRSCSPSASSTAVLTVDRRSFPLRSDKVVAIGHGIDLAAFPCVEPRARRRLRAARARAHLAGEGARDDRRAVPLARAPTSSCDVHGPSLSTDEERTRRASGSSASSPGRARAHRRAGAARRRPGAARGARTCSSTTCATARSTRSSTRRRRPACPCSRRTPASTTCSPPELRFPREDAGRPRREARARSRRSTDARALGRELRARVEAGHSVEHWADERAARWRVSESIVLHVAEGRRHLGLRGAPALAAARSARARLGHPLPDAPRGRAGRLGVRARARGRRRAGRRDPACAPTSTRPRSCGCSPTCSRTGRRSCTRTSSTPTPTARRPARSRGCRCGSRPSTASTSSARAGCSRSATARSARSRTARSRSRAGSRATSPRPRASPSRTSRSSTTASPPAPEPAPYAGAEPRFLCIGRLIPIKGHVVLLRAFEQVLDERPDARLDIAGRGVARARAQGPRARARARRGGALPRPRDAGPARRSRSRAVVVVPSLGEGFGMVALEAMERARPVIAASIGGLEDLVARRRDRACSCRPGDADPLADAMLAARERPRRAREMGAAGARPRASSASPRTAAPSGPRRSTASGSTAGAPPRSTRDRNGTARARRPRAPRAGSPRRRGSASFPAKTHAASVSYADEASARARGSERGTNEAARRSRAGRAGST